MHENFPQVWKQRKGSYVANTTSAFCQLCLFCQYQDLEEAKRKQCRELKSHQQEIEELSFVMQRWQRDLENVKNQVQWAAFTLENVPSFILSVGSQILFLHLLCFFCFHVRAWSHCHKELSIAKQGRRVICWPILCWIDCKKSWSHIRCLELLQHSNNCFSENSSGRQCL